MRIKRCFIAVTALFALIFTGAGCSKDAARPLPGAVPAKKTLTVKVVKVTARQVARSVEATGTLAARDESVVSSESQGTVEKVAADLGDRVKAGDTLAVLDQREVRLNLADAEAVHETNMKTLEKERARAADSTATLGRYEQLYKSGMVSTSQYDNVRTQSEMNAAQVKEAEGRSEQSAARVNLAKKRLTDTIIKSPIDGEVKRRMVSVGESVREKTPVYTIVSTGALKFRGAVAEASVPDIKTGAEIMIAVDAYKGRLFKGTIVRISPAVDVETRTLDIEAAVPNPQNLLKPGFFAKAVVYTGRDNNVPFVNEAAVYSFIGITKVFVIDGGKAREKTIKVGIRVDDTVEIIGPIKPGDTLATSNLANIYEGADVIIQGSK